MEKQQKFLEKIADFLMNDVSDEFQHSVVVSPNHRSAIFLKKYLIQKSEKSLWLPDMITIDDLMTNLSGLTILDPLLINFELFKIHKEIVGSKARTFDEFMSWGTMIMNDFSDIDYHLADAPKLFNELSDIKALEKWNLDGEPLTHLQKNYLSFFRSLSQYYIRLRNRLIENKKAYKALAYRYLAENIDEIIEKGIIWKRFVFVGINALTPAEVTVLRKLKNNFKFDYFIDADKYYFSFEKEKRQHEASIFLKKAINELKIESPRWIEDHLISDEKNIEVKGIPKQIGQIRYAGQKLFEWIGRNPEKLQNTAVVLSDESLLMPLLSFVPTELNGNKIPYNVTLGYPLKESSLHHLVEQWIDLLIERQKTGGKFPLNQLLVFFKNPVFLQIQTEEVSLLVEKLKAVNTSFPDIIVLENYCTEAGIKGLFELFFKEVRHPVDLLNNFITFLQIFQKKIEPEHNLLKYQLLLMFWKMKNLSMILSENPDQLSFFALRKIVLQTLQSQTVSLKGEPLSGIQVMGLLETRNLDFENLIVLSANEGILPKNSFQDSFIPFDLKRSFNLPLPNNKTAVFSYHLLRLLQRAKNIVFIYNTEPDPLGGGEPSRFILQLEQELTAKNPNIHFSSGIVPVQVDALSLSDEIKIERTSEVKDKLENLAKTGISPSAINSFINCPLQFYLNYVLRVKLPEQAETEVETDTFGNVIHGVLQNIFKQFTGKEIDNEILIKEKQNVNAYLATQFKKYYGQSELNHGKNRLIYHVAQEYINRYLDFEIHQNKKRQLLGVEVEVATDLIVEGKLIRCKGKIDRIDKHDNLIQIIDYKTGKVEPGDVRIKEVEKLFSDKKYAKALQVATYAWLYHKNYKPANHLHSGLISLRSSKIQLLNVLFNDLNIKSWTDDLEMGLKDLLHQIFISEEPFTQTVDASNCKYCDFKKLCNR